MHRLGPSTEWTVERISNDNGLPGDPVLRGPGRFAKTESPQEPIQERRDVGSARQIWLIDAPQSNGGALVEQRPDPVLAGRAERLRAKRMQMVGERAGHELHGRPRERPGDRSVIPAAVTGDLAHP